MCALWLSASRTKQVYYDLMMYFVTNAGIFMCFSCSFAQSSIEWCENWDTIIHRVNAMKCDELRSLAHGVCNIGKRSEKNNTQRNGRRVMITAWKVERGNEKTGKQETSIINTFLSSINRLNLFVSGILRLKYAKYFSLANSQRNMLLFTLNMEFNDHF